MQSLRSPDGEVFSTPPTTPNKPRDELRPSLSRRSSRPSNLRLEGSVPGWAPDVVLDQQHSPEYRKSSTPAYRNGHHQPSPLVSTMGTDPALTQPAQHVHPSSDSGASHHAHLLPDISPNTSASAVSSPYFVHSQLQSFSYQDYLQAKKCKAIHDARMDYDRHHPRSAHSDTDEDDYIGSLTRQLAETAVGVREMSKQLGRTRVHSHIQTVLIVTKARDNRLIKLTRQLALYLMLRPSYGGRGMVVYVDAQLKTSRRFDAAGIERDHPELFLPFPRRRSSSASSFATNSSKDDNGSSAIGDGQLRYWTADMCNHSPHLFDFVVTLGGDGTVLFTSWLFQRIVPPVLSFALGSLGFLTNFDFADHAAVMDNAIDNGIRVNLRMRFTCTVYRAVALEEGRKRRAIKKGDTGEILMKNIEQGGWEALESGYQSMSDGNTKGCGKDKEIMCFTTRPVESFEVLNDLVVDRGPSPYVSLLELFGDEHHLTTVQADGLCISTPTGSTAYSLSAGGSLVHPEIPAILITPICPHTLSFRPMLLPDSMELRICVPFNSRSTAWASFDGRGRVELKQGDHIKVTASKYPFPTVCADTQSIDWFTSISRTLKWNERERQKSFVVVEEAPSHKHQKRRKALEGDKDAAGNEEHLPSPTPGAQENGHRDTVGDEEDECSDEEGEDEEDEKFDIDDLSSNESPPQSIPEQERLGKEKVQEVLDDSVQARAENVARLLTKGNPFAESQSKPGLHSGLETPDRFAGPHPHPPKVSPRHVQFAPSNQSSSSSLVSMSRDPTVTARGERGTRDDRNGYLRRSEQSRSRTPRTREREPEADTLQTPKPFEETHRRSVSRSRSRERHHEGHARRAFAVWGQDESDSAASDSDA